MVVLVYASDKELLSNKMKHKISVLESVGYQVKVVDSNDWEYTQGLKVSGIIIDEVSEEY